MNLFRIVAYLVATLALCVNSASAERQVRLPDFTNVRVSDEVTDEAALAIAQQRYPAAFACDEFALDVSNEIKAGSLRRFQDRYELCKKSSTYALYSPTVYLFSPGGSVTEALAIGRLIRKLKLNVTVWGECFSSCVFILAAGSDKTVDSAAKIGIHRPFLVKTPNENIETAMRRILAESKAYLAEMNIPEQLADAMFSTPPERLLILTKEQLQFYRLDQMDMAEAEQRALSDAKWLGISRQELMRRTQLADEGTKRECYPLMNSNKGTERSRIQEFGACFRQQRVKYGVVKK